MFQSTPPHEGRQYFLTGEGMMEAKELEEAIKCWRANQFIMGSGHRDYSDLERILSLAETHLAVMKAQGMPKDYTNLAPVYFPHPEDHINYKKGYNQCRNDFIAWLTQRVDEKKLED